MEKGWQPVAHRCRARRKNMPLSFAQESLYSFAQTHPHHPRLFKVSTIRRFLSDFEMMLRNVTAQPDRTIVTMPLAA